MKHSLASLLAGTVLLSSLLPTPARAATMILHSFTGSFTGNTTDGLYPHGSVTLSGSKLYGMTETGGTSNLGTLFSINTDGTGFGVVHTFSGGITDGESPLGSLTLFGSKLYGMTRGGGYGARGTLYRMNIDGSGYTLLHNFTGGANDGDSPYGALTLSGSKLYGMTYLGGSGLFRGTIFSMNTDGTGFSLLHSFLGGASDGVGPAGSLTLLGSVLYGTTASGGTSNGGTLFRMATNGTGFSLLHSFSGGGSDGANPGGSLTLSGSKLYGMTSYGGTGNYGTIFSINTNGSNFGLIESFAGTASSGGVPYYGDLTLSGDGATLYGMTHQGGIVNGGVVFSKSVVPEPSAIGLLGFGTLLLCVRRRNART